MLSTTKDRLKSLWFSFKWPSLDAILQAVLMIAVTHSESFRLGSKTVTISSVAGKPVHLTFAMALHAAECALAGTDASLQSGDTLIVVS